LEKNKKKQYNEIDSKEFVNPKYARWKGTSYDRARQLGSHRPLFFLGILCQ